MKDRYKTPGALESAIRSKAGEVARKTGRSPGYLVEGFYFQRMLARIFLDDGAWMLKGGQSLLMRYPGRARLSRDVDLFLPDTDTIDEALAALDRALARDLDDFFRFERSTTGTDGAQAQIKINTWIGSSAKSALNVDLVVCRTPTGVPTAQPMQPEIPIDWPDTWPELQLYPLCDHIADKICAMYERHPRVGRDPVASTRHRDLGDLLLIAQSSEVIGAQVQAALRSEVPRRRALGTAITLPTQFEVPDRAAWAVGYPKAAREITGLKGCRTLDEASAAAEVFISPLLSSTDPGIWDPRQGAWKV